MSVAARVQGLVWIAAAALVSVSLPPVQRAAPPELPSLGQPALVAQNRFSQFVVAPNGRATNPGTASRPLDLGTALSAHSPARPGDTVWLMGGIYADSYESYLEGSQQFPIIVRQLPGQRATLSGRPRGGRVPTLTVWGSHTWYWGFEVTGSSPSRSERGTGVQVYGPYTRFINLVVHDTGNGFGVWSPAVEAELYGNLIYDNGWDGRDRGHGHGIYAQNRDGVRRIVDNLLFGGYGFGIHVYTQRGNIDNVDIEGNIAFNHGERSAVSGPTANILVGGRRVANRPRVTANYTYYRPQSSGINADLGKGAGCREATVTDNYFIGGIPLVLSSCPDATVTNNVIRSKESTALLARRSPDNTYLGDPLNEPTVIVRPNRYEPGRAQVAVYNWPGHQAVSLGLDGTGLEPGDAFEIRDAEHYFDAPVLSAVYAGAPIRLSLGVQDRPPTGATPGRSEFHAFVVIKTPATRSSIHTIS